MAEPVISREGHSYERTAILTWIAEHGTSPLTRKLLRPAQLVRNRSLQTMIKFFLSQHGVESYSSFDAMETKFMGFIAMTNAKNTPVIQTPMTLESLASVSLQAREEPAASASRNSSVSHEHLAARRREIANMIMVAMSELDQ